MTLSQAFELGSSQLGSTTARSDAETLLRHVLGISRVEFFLRLDRPLDDTAAKTYFELINRLAAGEPLQYLTGYMEFYRLDFYVNSSVLIPRPETEIMVGKALEIARTYVNPVIADVGCGSGAVAVTLAKNLPQSRIFALDISTAALDLARRNALLHNCINIEFIESDLLDAVTGRRLDIICANLPYVPSAEARNNCFEPQLALDGGSAGLDVIRRLVQQTAAREAKPDWLLLEFGTGQAEAVTSILEGQLRGSRTEILRDLIPVERVSVTRL